MRTIVNQTECRAAAVQATCKWLINIASLRTLQQSTASAVLSNKLKLA